MTEVWQVCSFQSGTVIVSSDQGGPHYYMWQVPGDNEGEHQRYRQAEDLASWLNGKTDNKPSWLSGGTRTDSGLRLVNGGLITATGPSIDIDGKGWWRENRSVAAKLAREQLLDRLEVPGVPDLILPKKS